MKTAKPHQKTYIVHYPVGSLLADPTFIQGTSGVDAVSRLRPNDVALYKRYLMYYSDYIVQQVIEKDGKTYYKGPCIGVKRLIPHLEKRCNT